MRVYVCVPFARKYNNALLTRENDIDERMSVEND